MAITITMGIQKGGCGKSTTTGVLAHLLSSDGYRVLAVDLDSQGNLTELLTQLPSNEFIGRSILEAVQENDVAKYIYPISKNFDLLPANNFLATFQRWLYTNKTYKGETRPYSAIPNFMDSISVAQEISKHDLKIAGILRTMNDVRRTDAKAFNELIQEDHPELVFETIITRRAPTGRLSLYGFEENIELKQALIQYKKFYKELMARVKD